MVILLLVYALLAFVAYAFVPFEQLLLSNQTPSPVMAATARWLIGLGEGGGVLILYVVFGISGFGFARRLGLPGVFREGAGWQSWLLWPALLGLALRSLLVLMDRVFVAAGSPLIIPRPVFPLSLIASVSAGIGEECLSFHLDPQGSRPYWGRVVAYARIAKRACRGGS